MREEISSDGKQLGNSEGECYEVKEYCMLTGKFGGYVSDIEMRSWELGVRGTLKDIRAQSSCG